MAPDALARPAGMLPVVTMGRVERAAARDLAPGTSSCLTEDEHAGTYAPPPRVVAPIAHQRVEEVPPELIGPKAPGSTICS